MARDARADVELVDDDDEQTPDAAAPVRDDRRRRRLLVAGAAVLVVLVAAGAVAQAVVGAREREHLAALEGVPGLVDPVDRRLRAVELTDPGGVAFTTARTASGALVGAYVDADGRAYAAAVDPDDPDDRWETTLFTGEHRTEAPGAAASYGSRHGCGTIAPRRELVVCHADDHATDATGGRVPGGASARRLVVLDAADGAVVTDLTDLLPAWRWPGATVLDDLVLVSGVDDDGAHVRALTTDGAVAWETTLPDVPPDGWVEVTAGTGSAAVLTVDRVRLVGTTGAVVQDVPLQEATFAQATVRGEFALRLFEPDGVLLVGTDGARTLRGGWVPLGVDDGSVPGLALTVDADGLHAWDADGGERWVAPVRAGEEQAAILLDGRVTVGAGTAVVTLDATTGDEVWTTDGLLPGSGLATDGRVVLSMAPEAGTGARREVAALDLRDGGQAWRVTLPGSVDHVSSHLGVLTALTWTDAAGPGPVGARATLLR